MENGKQLVNLILMEMKCLSIENVKKIMKQRKYYLHFSVNRTKEDVAYVSNANFVRDFGQFTLHCFVDLEEHTCELSYIVGFNMMLHTQKFSFLHPRFYTFQAQLKHYAIVCKQNSML